MKASSFFKIICYWLLAGFMPLFGCASNPKLSPEAALVRSVTAEQTGLLENKCLFVGNVSGKASVLYFEIAAHDVSFANLLENSADLGATHVFINDGNSYAMRGIAFFCAFCKKEDGLPFTSYCKDKDDNPVTRITIKRTCLSNGHQWVTAPQNKGVCNQWDGEWVENPEILRRMTRD